MKAILRTSLALGLTSVAVPAVAQTAPCFNPAANVCQNPYAPTPNYYEKRVGDAKRAEYTAERRAETQGRRWARDFFERARREGGGSSGGAGGGTGE